MFFGSYLVARGLVTAEQVLRALDAQYKLRTPVGRIAVREGRMTIHQVIETLNSQADFDLRFGEAAIRLGYLEEEDLDRLLQIQRREAPPIGMLLSDMGALDRSLMEEALSEFHAGKQPASASHDEELQEV